MKTQLGNVGTQLVVLQEQYNHQKRLQQIYEKNQTCSFRGSAQSQKHLRSIKPQKNTYQKEQHLKNITKLLKVITRQKTVQERTKNPHDFMAYPSLFKRTVTQGFLKKKTNRTVTGNRRVIKLESSEHFAYKTPIFTKDNLPELVNFDQEELQEWARAVSKFFQNFQLTQKHELLTLAAKAISFLPKHCPPDFRHAAQQILDDICSDKVDIW